LDQFCNPPGKFINVKNTGDLRADFTNEIYLAQPKALDFHTMGRGQTDSDDSRQPG